MPINYKEKVENVFVGPARIFYGTDVPFSAANLSGNQPSSGSFAGLTKRGSVVRVTFRTKLDYYRFEGDHADSEAMVNTEEMEIQAGSCSVYGSEGKAFCEKLLGNRMDGSGNFGKTSGGTYATNSFTVIGVDQRSSSRLLVASMYKFACEEYTIEMDPSGVSVVSFTLKGLLHSTEGIGKKFHV